MSEKELYQRKIQAKLDEWEAEAEKLRARTVRAGADARLDAKRRAEELERKIERGKEHLAEVRDAAEDTWSSVKARVDAAWKALTSEVRDLAGKAGS